MKEILLTSLCGIDAELRRRYVALRLRRYWYLSIHKQLSYYFIRPRYVTASKTEFSWQGFYLEGYKILKEIQKLKLIKHDLQSLANHFNKHF